MPSTCYDVFATCVSAVQRGELIEKVGEKDKEFHFQNWFQIRLQELGLYFESSGRNTYPDFRMVNSSEGYEVKGLAWPGREKDYDSNSQVPTGYHNGREIYYVFGRYPADLVEYPSNSNGNKEYPVIDLVICHGDFLNADHNYIHKNRSVKGFGSYGDIMIRDRKMHVAPTPFAITEGTTGLMTLIVPCDRSTDERFVNVGDLIRVEAADIVIGYKFDLRSNKISAEKVPNPHAGEQHRFTAYRMHSQSQKHVSIVQSVALGSIGGENEE